MSNSSGSSFPIILYLAISLIISIFIGPVTALPFGSTFSNSTAPGSISESALNPSATSLPHFARSTSSVSARAENSTSDLPPGASPTPTPRSGVRSLDPDHPTGQSSNVDGQPEPTPKPPRPAKAHSKPANLVMFAAERACSPHRSFDGWDHTLRYGLGNVIAAVDRFGNISDLDAVCTFEGACGGRREKGGGEGREVVDGVVVRLICVEGWFGEC